MTILVTGGAGFIGANFILGWLKNNQERVINLDKLTYAGNLRNLESLEGDDRLEFVQGDIADTALVARLLNEHKPRAVINFAAESHVDRSIHGPAAFIQTNIVGTFHLLETVRGWWSDLAEPQKSDFRFLHISTDEVYGSLEADAHPFTEYSQYQPNSPYSASKASSDHLMRAYYHTYGTPIITTNCSNNYGPHHFPEKMIPLMIHRCLTGGALPVYGDGQNVRDWLYVGDHCAALRLVLAKGRCGETYNIGGRNEKTNLEVVHEICDILDADHPKADGTSYRTQITHVQDRPGHDRRYAIDSEKITKELGWKPEETFKTGLRKTVQWFVENQDWVKDVTSGEYREWTKRQYRA